MHGTTPKGARISATGLSFITVLMFFNGTAHSNFMSRRCHQRNAMTELITQLVNHIDERKCHAMAGGAKVRNVMPRNVTVK